MEVLCLSLRIFILLTLCYRKEGLGELYAYLSPTESNLARLAAVPPISIQNPDYGFSVGRGAWTFRPGRWATVVERVKLNDPGVKNGSLYYTRTFHLLSSL